MFRSYQSWSMYYLVISCYRVELSYDSNEGKED